MIPVKDRPGDESNHPADSALSKSIPPTACAIQLVVNSRDASFDADTGTRFPDCSNQKNNETGKGKACLWGVLWRRNSRLEKKDLSSFVVF